MTGATRRNTLQGIANEIAALIPIPVRVQARGSHREGAVDIITWERRDLIRDLPGSDAAQALARPSVHHYSPASRGHQTSDLPRTGRTRLEKRGEPRWQTDPPETRSQERAGYQGLGGVCVR